jgi:acetoacetate decarboxylase
MEMSFSLTREQLYKLANTHSMPDFPNAEMIVAIFKTDPDVIREILPYPLSLPSDARGIAFVARYPETNFGCVYNEGALLLNCEYKGERGLYCLSMPVDDDMAMASGRERFGYPKKMADGITLESDGYSALGSVTRKGTEILRIECQLDQDAPDDFLGDLSYPIKDWDGVNCHKIVVFLFKHFSSPSGDSFDYLPRLVREPVLFRHLGELKSGKGQVSLASTPYDPLGEVPVVATNMVFYGVFHNTMLPGKVVGRVWKPLSFVKHAFFKYDFAPTIIENFDPSKIERAKDILREAKKY